MPLTAGVAVVDITSPAGTPLDGYGGRLDAGLGVHDPLHARALVLDDGATRLALVVCDLVGVGAHLVATARDLIAERPGISPTNVLIAATHTHAGPAGVRGRGDPALVEMIARKIAGAVLTASLNMQPVALKYGRMEFDGISQNRRDPDWPIDNRLDVLAIDTTDSNRNLATIARYSCHPTVTTGANLLVSADYPGAACNTIEAVVGEPACALFFNGCCGNINPSWMRREFDEVQRVGSIVGAHAAGLSQLMRPLGGTHAADNIRWDEATPRPVTAGRLVEPSFAVVTKRFEAPFRTGPGDEELAGRIDALAAEHEAATGPAKRDVAARLTAARMERLALQRIAGQGLTREQEVQAMRLGRDLYLVALPGEVFVETQEEIREQFGESDLIVISYANDYPGYFCRAEAYEQGGYEAGVTPFAPGAEALLVETAIKALTEVR